MLNLIYPEIADQVYEGWVNSIKENGGRVPEWPSPGNAAGMIGSMSDISMAEGIVNGIIKSADIELVYAAMLKNAFEPSKTNARKNLESYMKLGYVPGQVSETLNYMLADYSISRVALLLNDTKNAQELEHRAHSWPSIFDHRTKFFRGKSAKGNFSDVFDEFS